MDCRSYILPKNQKKQPPNFWVGIRNISDYSPFGILLAERTIETANFRRGFQGQETDDEVKGKGNSVNFKYRMHDPRVGRFFALDPLAGKYPFSSTYSFSENCVISCVELEGLEKYYTADGVLLGSIGNDQTVYVVSDKLIKSKGGVEKVSKNLQQIDNGIKSGYGPSTEHKKWYDSKSKSLKMSETEYKRLAGVLYAEDATTVESAAAIYSVLENRAENNGTTVSQEATVGNGVVGAGHTDKINDPGANKQQVKNAYLGLYKAATSKKDYSDGAFFWDGYDFDNNPNTGASIGNKSNGGYRLHYLEGYKFTDPSHDLWGQGNFKKAFQYTTVSNKNVATGYYKYQSTAAFGKTTFHKLTFQWRDSQQLDVKNSDGSVTKKLCGPTGTSQGQEKITTKPN